MSEFKVGDRVRHTAELGEGGTGTVSEVRDKDHVAVRFDTPISGNRDWLCTRRYLRAVAPPAIEGTCSACGHPLVQAGDRTYHPWTDHKPCPALLPIEGTEHLSCDVPTEMFVPALATLPEGTDLVELLAAQIQWSRHTFGPGRRTEGVLDHIRKELDEVEADPADVEEWIDVVILALDGAWRNSGQPAEDIVEVLRAKYEKNRARTWPDWRVAAADKAIEHMTHLPRTLEVAESYVVQVVDPAHSTGWRDVRFFETAESAQRTIAAGYDQARVVRQIISEEVIEA